EQLRRKTRKQRAKRRLRARQLQKRLAERLSRRKPSRRNRPRRSSGEESRKEEREVINELTSSYNRPPNRHRAELDGVSGARRIHVPRRQRRNQDHHQERDRAALWREGHWGVDFESAWQGAARRTAGW